MTKIPPRELPILPNGDIALTPLRELVQPPTSPQRAHVQRAAIRLGSAQAYLELMLSDSVCATDLAGAIAETKAALDHLIAASRP